MRTITINFGHGVENNPNHYGFEVVDEYGRTTGHLCLGELIEQVSCMVHPKLNEVRYAMCTPEQWANRWAGMKAGSLTQLPFPNQSKQS